MSYTGLAQGAHVPGPATDTAGNTDASPASFGWTIDVTTPATVVAFPLSGGTYNAAGWADIEGTASDTGGGALDRVEVSIRRVATGLWWNGSGFAAGSESWLVASGTTTWSQAFAAGGFPADGDYVVRVRATDTATNVEAPNAYSVTYDTGAPNTTITAQPSDPSNSGDPSFSFTASEGGSTFECRLDGGPWGTCASPKAYTGLTQGSHAFDVRASDAAGNTDPTPASFTWTIDTTAPTGTIAFPAAAGALQRLDLERLLGSAADTGGAAVDSVRLSIRRVADGLYWNGTAFADVTETWHFASGTTSWTLAFPASSFAADGSYSIASGCATPPTTSPRR